MTSPAPAELTPAKAIIQRLAPVPNGTAEKPPTPTAKNAFSVQFNPTSLKLQRHNNTSTGVATQAQRRQQANEGHATLSLDLIFDTAEGGPDGNPLDVRTLTGRIRQFAEPDPKAPKAAPPRLRFIWGKFSFTGLVEQITEELDYFDHDGMALRAKVGLTITSQNEEFEAGKIGPGGRDAALSTPPGDGPPNSDPGATPAPNPTQTAAAQAGESVQQLLTRLGADPATWRSAMSGLDTPLGLDAGAEVQLSASVTAGAGIGVSAGFSAGASVDLGGGLGAGAGAGVTVGGIAVGGIAVGGSASGTVGVSAEASAGFAFSARGGVAASAGQAQAAAAVGAVAEARSGFDVPAVSGSASVSVSVSVEAQAEAGTISRTAAAAAAASVDPRAVGYGRGVPLRPRPTQVTGR